MSERTFKGIPAAPGIAIGRAFNYHPLELSLPRRQAESPNAEMARFQAACERAGEELSVLKQKTLERAGSESAAIFDAHVVILADPMLHDAVKKRVDAGQTIEHAIAESAEEIAGTLSAMEDELLAARATDVRDLGQRVLRILLGAPDTSLDGIPQPSIVVAHDLTPSDTASLHPELVLGFCTAVGGTTSHTSILARTLGIPAVVGLGQTALEQIEDGALLCLDGAQGTMTTSPSQTTQERYKAAREQHKKWVATMTASVHHDAHTADGKRIEVGANVGDIASAREAAQLGAEGIGLLRTEFLYLKDTQPPDEEKQIETYRAIFETSRGLPVVVRTLDIGGDKPPTYLEFPEELNPFLGWRAIRICLDDVELFETQLRAVLRAAVGYHVMIMYPMISGLEELRRANAILQSVQAQLDKEGQDYARDVPIGIMVETPAAALMADVLSTECDFFSLGTNDLGQYTLAVDRTNERVAALFQPLHPALLRLIKQTIDAAHGRGAWVGMCGEMAGMSKAIPILLGLGLDEFSMVPRAIPEAKWLVGQLTSAQTTEIASHVLTLSTAAEVEAYMREILGGLGIAS